MAIEVRGRTIDAHSLRRATTAGSTLLILVLLLGLSVGLIQPPVVAIVGDSMEPTYSQGDAIVVTPADTSTIEAGDIVVVDVPASAQMEYNYPPSVVHRVESVDRSGPVPEFQTQGDNTGLDPFTVGPDDIAGTVSYHIPYLGYILLYFQSLHGKLMLAAAFLVYIYYFYGPQIQRRIAAEIERTVQLYTPTPPEGAPEAAAGDAATEELVEEIEENNEKVDQVDASLEQFADAMGEYAVHLQSHTEAVQEMGQAAVDIQESVETQQQFLAQLADEDSLAGGDQPTPDLSENVPGRATESDVGPESLGPTGIDVPAGEEDEVRSGDTAAADSAAPEPSSGSPFLGPPVRYPASETGGIPDTEAVERYRSGINAVRREGQSQSPDESSSQFGAHPPVRRAADQQVSGGASSGMATETVNEGEAESEALASDAGEGEAVDDAAERESVDADAADTAGEDREMDADSGFEWFDE